MAIGIDYVDSESIITVMGVGGGGGNAVNNMIESGLDSVKFVVANTDKQALDNSKSSIKIHMGEGVRGAGADPEIGEKSAEFSLDLLKEQLAGTEMLFITAGMGGGTGTGASPVIARTAKQMGILTVAIVSYPFIWEGQVRQNNAKRGLEKLRESVDALIMVPNDKLLSIIDNDVSFMQAYKMVDEVLFNATKGISDIISKVGHVNVDFADVKTIMRNMGDALMGLGKASGKEKAKEAAKAALNSPLLDGVTIRGSKGVLVNVTGGANLTMRDVSDAVSLIHESAGKQANLIHGVVIDENLNDEIHVTVVATGFRSVPVVEQTIILEPEEDVRIPEPSPNGEKGGTTTRVPKGPFDKFGNGIYDVGGTRVTTSVQVFEPKPPPVTAGDYKEIEQPATTRIKISGPHISQIATANQATFRRMNEDNFSNLH